MKITLRLIMAALVLLMAAPVANAQTSGKLCDKNSEPNAWMTYSFSGGTVIDIDDSEIVFGKRRYTCEVSPGDIITFQCKANGTYSNGNPCRIHRASIMAGAGTNLMHSDEKKHVPSASFSYTVPKEALEVSIVADASPIGVSPKVIITFRVVKDKPNSGAGSSSGRDWANDPDCECKRSKDNQKIDSHIRFNDFYGEVKIRPNCAEDDSYEFVDLDTKIYECDRIKTEEESGAILGLEDMSTYVIKPESILVIWTEEDNTSRIEIIAGALWGNIKKMAQGKSIECEMSQCVAGISGTIFALEETSSGSKVWLFSGKVDVTNKKTGKKTVLQPGQNITCKGSTSNVKSFDIEQGAKKFGIKMSDINNHYSNKKQEIEDGTYVIRFTHNPEYVLTLKDGKAVNNNVIHLWKWQNTNAQKWKVTHKDGKIAIRSAVDPNFALDVKSFNYSNNADIILYKYLGNDNQLWIPERLDNGAYILKTAGNPTFCLDLYKGNAKNGGKIELYNAHKLWPEWWTLEKVSK